MRSRTILLRATLIGVAAIAIQVGAAVSGRSYYLLQLTMAAYTAAVVMGLCLLVGYAGQVSLGHAGFLAIGGYTSAILTTHDFSSLAASALGRRLVDLGVLVQRQGLYGGEALVSFHPWAGAAAALVLAAAAAAALGWPALRLKGHYLAMATLGFGLIVYKIVLASSLTGAADGITGVPALPLVGDLYVSGRPALRVANYYIATGFLLLTLVFLLNVVHSRAGRALRAIHGDEQAAAACGVDVAAWKLKVFVLSAVLAALTGVFTTHFRGSIGPSEAGVLKSVRYLALVAAGGMANVEGALAVGFVLTFLSLRGCFGTYDHAVFGGVLIAIMALAPDGPFRPLVAAWNTLVRSVYRHDVPAKKADIGAGDAVATGADSAA